MNHHFLQKLDVLLKEANKIIITCHKNPDGDAIGSSLALFHYLKGTHEVRVIVPNDFPKFLKWMPGADDVFVYDYHPEQCDRWISDAQVIFSLDYNVLSRTGNMEKTLQNASANYVMIDHHESPDSYSTLCYSDTKMSSTCEMVFHTLTGLNSKSITQEIASCLYTGLMTDTGSFKYPSTTSTTHRVVASLIDAGANGFYIHNKIYDTSSPSRLKLLGRTLENMNLIADKKTAYMFLSQNDLDEHDFKKGDTEGFVNYGLSLEGILFSAIFIENREEGIIKISFRSKGDFSVNDFARNHFNGGGHHNAAGGRTELSLDKTIEKFLRIIQTEHP